MPFARQAGGSTPLLSAAEQAEQDARFDRIFFGPWQMKKATVKRRSASAIFRKARGYKHDDVRWTQAEWDGIARNARMNTYPNTKAQAITIRNTDLREMPTPCAALQRTYAGSARQSLRLFPVFPAARGHAALHHPHEP